MKKLKMILKFQLVIFPSLAVLIFIIFLTWNHYQKLSYKELSAKDFIAKIKANSVSEMNITDNRYEIIIKKTGEKYFHQCSTLEKNELEAFGSDNLSVIYNHKKNLAYALPWLIGTILLIILIFKNIIVWMISLFDLLKSEFINNSNKWIWWISLMLIPFIAPYFYLFIAEKQKLYTC